MHGRITALALLAASVLAADAAAAATVEVVDSYRPQVVHAIPPEPLAVVTIKGGPEVDVVTVSRAGTAVHVTDSAGLLPGKGCVAAADGSVICEPPQPLTPVLVAVDTGAGDDSVSTALAGTVAGGDGNDSLEATAAVLIGGAGDDVLVGNTASYAGHTAKVRIDLTAPGQPQGALGERDVLTGISAVIGGSGDDVLSGGKWLSGGPGDDVLTASAEASRLEGGPGDDRLVGGPGDDALDGWAGSDTLDGGGGNDALDAQSADDDDEFAPRDMFDDADDRNLLRGGAGGDSLAPGIGRDRLDGGRGRDGLVGLDPRDQAMTRDGAFDLIRCVGENGNVVVDRLDVTLGCGPRVRRNGTARPGFVGAGGTDFTDEPGSRRAELWLMIGCPSDMPRACRLEVVARQRGSTPVRATWTVRPGRDSEYRDVVLTGRPLRNVQCSGRFDVAFTVRTRDARGRPVTLRTRFREPITPRPGRC